MTPVHRAAFTWMLKSLNQTLNRHHLGQIVKRAARVFAGPVLVWTTVYGTQTVLPRPLYIALMIVFAALGAVWLFRTNRDLHRMAKDSKTFAMPTRVEVHGYCPSCLSPTLTQYQHLPKFFEMTASNFNDAEFEYFYRCDRRHQFEKPLDDFQLSLIQSFDDDAPRYLGNLRSPARLSRLLRRAEAVRDRWRSRA